MYDQRPYRVAVTGSSGQLGQELIRLSGSNPGFFFQFLNRSEFPLDDLQVMESWLKNNPVDFFIHGGAYTGVDKAETEKDKALLINATASGLIAAHLSKQNSRLIYISTDYVFNGKSSIPLREDAETDPVNWYGYTKLQGEKLVVQNNPNTQIIRTSWVHSAFGNNFVKTMMRLMKEKASVSVVNDQKGSPTYARDLAKTILLMIKPDSFKRGIYHFSNEGETSWFDFACEIKNQIGSYCEVLPVPSSGFPTPARRPAYSLLDKSKIKKDYELVIPSWKRSLANCIEQIKNGV